MREVISCFVGELWDFTFLLPFKLPRLTKHFSPRAWSTSGESDLISWMVVCCCRDCSSVASVYQSILDLLWASIKLNEHLNPLMDWSELRAPNYQLAVVRCTWWRHLPGEVWRCCLLLYPSLHLILLLPPSCLPLRPPSLLLCPSTPPSQTSLFPHFCACKGRAPDLHPSCVSLKPASQGCLCRRRVLTPPHHSPIIEIACPSSSSLSHSFALSSATPVRYSPSRCEGEGT